MNAPLTRVPPEPGEVRFYKKLFPTPRFDVLLQVGDCGCKTWHSAKQGERAKKGIARLEKRGDWKTIQHCASCTGGGVWRVQW